MSDDLARLTAKWNYPTTIRFGVGRINELAAACKELRMRHPLLVTDPGLAKLPMVQSAIAANKAAGLPTGLFRDIAANPVEKNVSDGVAVYRAGSHDGVIAFGGGAALDAAKAIAFMTVQHRRLWDFEDREDWWTRARTDNLPPVIAVPTTAGTGSEVGRAAVVLDEDSHTKKIIFHPRILPALVISDPALTVGLPPKVTAAVGMDALSHSLEAYCAPFFHPQADGIALEAMRMIHRWLPVAVSDGANLVARANMLAAASMGAAAFQKGLGAMHSLSHPCSAHLNTHHGLTNAVVMPYVLAFNRPAIAEKLTALARYLDLPKPSFDAAFDWIMQLREQIGIPNRLSDIGVEERHAAEFAPEALADPSTGGNPVPMDEGKFAELYAQAISGRFATGN
jgi:alcohol dehydrogenase class IV